MRYNAERGAGGRSNVRLALALSAVALLFLAAYLLVHGAG